MNVEDVLPRDAIPSIDDPRFGEAYFGDDGDEVLVVDGDPPRAYPLRVLSYHEVVNDRVPGAPAPVGRDGATAAADGGRPLAVTWCPICWSAVVYDRVLDGRELTFGVSGKLADDSLVLYDRETETEWQQTTGRAIAGAFEGRELAAVPATVSTYGAFRAAHPDGVVLQPVNGTDGAGGPSPADAYDMAPYEGYRERDAFGLYGMRGEGDPREWDRADLAAKTVVLGVELDGAARGYPAPAVADAGGVLADTLAGTDLLVVGDGDRLHAYADPGFALALEGGELRGDGTAWDPATGESADGRRLDRLPARRLFAFAWRDAHGPAAFYGD